MPTPPPHTRKRLALSSSSSESDTKPSLSRPQPKRATPAPPPPPPPPAATEDDEDDYMSMSIPDPTPTRETLTQRTRRLARESEIRGNPKSKADLAREEKAKREAALAKSIIDAEAERSSKGLRMMKMMGFTPGSGLGRKRKVEGEEDEGVGEGVGTTWKPEGARLEPVGVAVKEDRSGIGHAAETARRVREAGGGAAGEVREADPAEYRERVRVEREEKRLAAQLYAAQKVCEKMDMARDHGVAEADIGKAREIPLTSINVLWRGMVRQRERRERERRARYDMEQSLGQPRLPGYDRLHELDEVDKVALGIEPAVLGEKGKIFVEDEEEDEDEDEELNAFEESPVGERLDRIVRYLREEFKYCFWCKYQYEDDEMEGCPGTDEDSHG